MSLDQSLHDAIAQSTYGSQHGKSLWPSGFERFAAGRLSEWQTRRGHVQAGESSASGVTCA